MVVTAVIVYIIAAGNLALGTTQLLQKGKPINNAYLYANEEERRAMDWRPYFRQSGIVFLMLGLQFLMLGFFCISRLSVFLIAEFLLLGTVVIYAVASSILIEKNKKKGTAAGNEK